MLIEILNLGKKSFFAINTLFTPLRYALCAGTGKFFVEAPELLRHTVFQLVFVVRKTSSSEGILQGAKKSASRRVLIGAVRRMREKKFNAQTRAGKVTAIVFWNREEVMLAEFFDRGAPKQFKAMCGDI